MQQMKKSKSNFTGKMVDIVELATQLNKPAIAQM